jgi:hypothetical protein
MTQPGAAVPNDRRTRWADRENARRQALYQNALVTWQADTSELASMIEEARSFVGTASTSVVLKEGESVLYELPVVSLVEVQRAPGHYTSGYSGFSFRIAKGIRYNVGGSRGTFVQGPELHKITDEGPATITNMRVIFQGSRNSREWAYSKMLGVQHDDSRPFTLMHVSNRQKVSGLLYAVSLSTYFRFYLSLGLARFQQATEAFVQSLLAEQTQHEAMKPTPPAVAAPKEAPAGVVGFVRGVRTAYIGRPGWPRGWRITQGVLTVGLTLGLLGSMTSSPAPHVQRSGLSSTPAATSTYSPEPVFTTQALPTLKPSRKPSAPHSVAPVVTHHTSPAPPRPAPKPSPAARTCGAPANPWGYNFCGRGSMISSPAADVCSYFDCIASFYNGTGYMAECNDGTYSMSGGRQGACSHHSGESRAVYSGSGPH